MEDGENINKTLLSFKDIELCCVISSNNNIYDYVPKECCIYKRWEEMLNHQNLDGIIVSTPHTHYEIAKSSLLKGIPVLVENHLL